MNDPTQPIPTQQPGWFAQAGKSAPASSKSWPKLAAVVATLIALVVDIILFGFFAVVLYEPLWAGERFLTRFNALGGFLPILGLLSSFLGASTTFWTIYSIQYGTRTTETPADDRIKALQR